jgi:hypothetical protein
LSLHNFTPIGNEFWVTNQIKFRIKAITGKIQRKSRAMVQRYNEGIKNRHWIVSRRSVP